MDIEKVLKYQTLDSNLYKLEKDLKFNQNFKKANELHESMKNAQNQSYKLEEKANNLLKDIEKVKGQVKTQEDKISEFIGKDIDSMSKEELEKIILLKNKLSQNLSILEKNLSALAENMNAILTEFNKTIKSFNQSKEEYAKRKQAYDENVKEADAQKIELVHKLDDIAKTIEPEVMELYKKKRNENIFPVLVPLNGNCCGGCHIELPFAVVNKLSEDGVITCEHCRRLVYRK